MTNHVYAVHGVMKTLFGSDKSKGHFVIMQVSKSQDPPTLSQKLEWPAFIHPCTSPKWLIFLGM